MRTFFMMLGIIIGTFALFISMSMGEGTKKKIMENVELVFGSSNIMVMAGGGGMMGGDRSDGPPTTLKMEDIEALANEVPNLGKWDPFQMAGGKNVSYLDKNVETNVFGGTHEGAVVWARDVVEGAYISPDDVESSARVALIGTKLASELFGEGDPIGQQIRIDNIPFEVKGILRSIGVDPHGIDRDLDVRVPITTLLRRVLNEDYLASVKFMVNDPALMEETEAQITEILRERHDITGGEQDDFSLITPKQVEAMVDSMNRIFTVFLPIIAGIATLVGAIVIASLMLIGVKERRLEIGLRKAVGARSGDIFFQFLIEAIAITVTGGLIGILLGLAFTKLVALTMSGMMPLEVSGKGIVLGLALPIVAGLLAGVIPARRAAGLEAVENLK